MNKGKFITVEGGEGVGKTTNMAFVETLLSDNSIDFISTREPGGTPLAEKIRALLLGVDTETLDSTAELLLIFAARAQHLSQLIKPALDAGRWVICDRFTDATYAYQGGGRGIDTSLIITLERAVQKDLQPDLTLLLDIHPEQGMQRARSRAALDRFELEELPFFHRVRASYLERAQLQPQRFALIDAGAALADVQKNIAAALRPLLQNAC